MCAATAAKFVQLSALDRWVATFTPSMEMAPPVGSRTPRTILMVVFFPAPFGPSSPTISFRFTTNEIPPTATVFPYVFERFSTERTSCIDDLRACLAVHDAVPARRHIRMEPELIQCTHHDVA